MHPFKYIRTEDAASAIAKHTEAEKTQFIAGGTNLVDRIRRDVFHPDVLIDINKLPYNKIEEHQGGLRLGALVSNSDTADHKAVKKNYPIVSEAILLGATDQLRNKATNGGNLMQRTRCSYYMSPKFPCNKREPGSGCAAMHGHNRILSILGTSENCIASFPSDMCASLTALEAKVNIMDIDGSEIVIPIEEFHALPGDTPVIDNILKPGQLITSIDLPASTKKFAKCSTYLKVRDRHSYAFALVSVAAAVTMEAGVITDARMAFGSIAPKPWRDKEAEKMFIGQAPSKALFKKIGEKVVKNAKGYGGNSFKIEMVPRVVTRAFSEITGLI